MRAPVAICEPVEGRLSKARVSGASTPCNLDKAQRDQFTDRGGDSVTMETELGEMLVRAREFTIFLGLAAVLSQFYFEPGHCAMSGQAEHAV